MTVHPQMILGDPSSGEGSDSVRTSFAKYNIHTHGQSFVSFFQWPISPGASIQARNISDNVQDIFPAGTTVTKVESSKLTVSNPAVYTADSNSEFTIGVTNFIGLQVTSGSSEITFTPVDGFVSAEKLKALSENFVHGSVLNPAFGHEEQMLLLPRFSGVITSLCGITNQNACDLQVLINGIALNPDLNVSTTVSEQEYEYIPSNDVSFSSTDIVVVRIINITGPLKVDFNLHYFKT